jgi:hypothetical protein
MIAINCQNHNAFAQINICKSTQKMWPKGWDQTPSSNNFRPASNRSHQPCAAHSTTSNASMTKIKVLGKIMTT